MKTIISCSLTFVCTPHWSNSQHSLLVCKPCMSTMTSRPRSYFNRANLKQQDMWKTRGQLLSLVHLISQKWSPIEVNKRQPDIQPGFLVSNRTMTALQGLTFFCQSSHWLNCRNPYLKLSLLVWPERLPLWRVEELVAVDVVQELALQRHVDPKKETESKIQG